MTNTAGPRVSEYMHRQLEIVPQDAQECAVDIGIDAATRSIYIEFRDPRHKNIVSQNRAAG